MIAKVNSQGHLEMTSKEFHKIHRDYRTKRSSPNHPAAVQLDPKTGGTVLYPVDFISKQ